MLSFTPPKVHSIMYKLICGGSHVSHLMVVLVTCLPSLMITLEKFDLISRKIQMIRFLLLKSGNVMIERQTERNVKLLSTDNGGKFCSHAFNDYCMQEGIVRYHTIPYMPQQNGVAERMNMTIISKTCCMLSNKEFLG